MKLITNVILNIFKFTSFETTKDYYMQSVSCEIKFARAHVRARSHVCDVRAKRLSKRACDVRACGRLRCETCDRNFARFGIQKRVQFWTFLTINVPFVINVRVRVRNEFWAKRTRACDVRAAEI